MFQPKNQYRLGILTDGAKTHSQLSEPQNSNIVQILTAEIPNSGFVYDFLINYMNQSSSWTFISVSLQNSIDNSITESIKFFKNNNLLGSIVPPFLVVKDDTKRS